MEYQEIEDIEDEEALSFFLKSNCLLQILELSFVDAQNIEVLRF